MSCSPDLGKFENDCIALHLTRDIRLNWNTIPIHNVEFGYILHYNKCKVAGVNVTS